ncbi:MAG: J domain-containing protein [Acidobacteria bacterium]|nr:J domain-containing protein [Acidobacteriota bacterium]
MSTPRAGKFQDHYEVLGVEPKADSETIHRAYQALALKYHANNKQTADKAKFDSVTQACEVLSDPVTRRVFDSVRGGPEQPSAPEFSGARFFDSVRREEGRRHAILCVLYDRRQQNSFVPSLSMRHLEGMLKVSSEELNFTIWYLKQRGYVISDDRSSLQITVEGMKFLEDHLPSFEDIAPFLKGEAE